MMGQHSFTSKSRVCDDVARADRLIVNQSIVSPVRAIGTFFWKISNSEMKMQQV